MKSHQLRTIAPCLVAVSLGAGLVLLATPVAAHAQYRAKPRLTLTQREVELQVADEAVVRQIKAPVEYDEKGRPRKLKAEELKKLKGDDPKVPGYKAEWADLKAGQVVKVYLARRKTDKTDSKDDRPDAEAKGAPKRNEPTTETEKTRWTSAGQVTASLARVGGQNRDKQRRGKNEEGANDVPKSITLRVEAAQLRGGLAQAQAGSGSSKTNRQVYVTMVVIMSDRSASAN
jgi:hypothetical protein